MGGIRQTEFDVGWRVRVGLEVQTFELSQTPFFVLLKIVQLLVKLLAVSGSD